MMCRDMHIQTQNIGIIMTMSKKISFSIFWLVLISIIGVVSSQQCNDTGYFELESTYGDNRKLILESLASNVTAHKGFYNSSIGEGPDRVFAMAMCIDGSEPAVCSECIEIAVEQLKYNCPNQTEAFTWAPHKTLCFARYSNISFFRRLSKHPRYSEHNSVGIKSYLEEYESKWKGSMKSMINTARDKNGYFSNRDYYSTIKVPLKNLLALYGLMQCTPDLVPADCVECLEESVGDYDELDFRGKQGGIIAYPSCFFRWDLYPFSMAFNPSKSSNCKAIITKTGQNLSFSSPKILRRFVSNHLMM